MHALCFDIIKNRTEILYTVPYSPVLQLYENFLTSELQYRVLWCVMVYTSLLVAQPQTIRLPQPLWSAL